MRGYLYGLASGGQFHDCFVRERGPGTPNAALRVFCLPRSGQRSAGLSAHAVPRQARQVLAMVVMHTLAACSGDKPPTNRTMRDKHNENSAPWRRGGRGRVGGGGNEHLKQPVTGPHPRRPPRRCWKRMMTPGLWAPLPSRPPPPSSCLQLPARQREPQGGESRPGPSSASACAWPRHQPCLQLRAGSPLPQRRRL